MGRSCNFFTRTELCIGLWMASISCGHYVQLKLLFVRSEREWCRSCSFSARSELGVRGWVATTFSGHYSRLDKRTGRLALLDLAHKVRGSFLVLWLLDAAAGMSTLRHLMGVGFPALEHNNFHSVGGECSGSVRSWPLLFFSQGGWRRSALLLWWRCGVFLGCEKVEE